MASKRSSKDGAEKSVVEKIADVVSEALHTKPSESDVEVQAEKPEPKNEKQKSAPSKIGEHKKFQKFNK